MNRYVYGQLKILLKVTLVKAISLSKQSFRMEQDSSLFRLQSYTGLSVFFVD